MLKRDLIDKFGIIEWYSRDAELDSLFSNSEHDPAFIAECDGYELSNGRPFVVSVFITPVICTTFVFIFNTYRSKVKFVSENLVVKLVL